MPLNFQTPQLYVEHKPDSSTEVDGSGVKHAVELPGHVYFGFVINGVKIPLGRKGTAGLLADIRRAQGAAASTDAAPAPDAQPNA